jgi:hypothetical protein
MSTFVAIAMNLRVWMPVLMALLKKEAMGLLY